MQKRFSSKHALVTGGTGAIGKAIVKRLLNEGAVVWLTGRVSLDEGKALAKTLGDNCHYLKLSVDKTDDWEAIASHFSAHQIPLNVLVNNAGIEYPHDANSLLQNPEICSLADWQSVFQVNVDGVFLGCQFAIKQMKVHGGAIVNIGSRSGLVGIPTSAAYGASKAAVNNFTRSVALHCTSKHYHIRCNAVHPAAIDTKMWDKELGTDHLREARKAKFASQIPLGRMGNAEDIAAAVAYLASDEAGFITGTEIVVDGGIMAGSSAAASEDEITIDA